jgi:pimeloyl-ACP methyl ester carboxylesterase
MTIDVRPAPTPVSLPRLHWGPEDALRRALLVHGLGSSAHTMWQLGEGLAAAGWSATAIDLRGHGVAPRTGSYRIVDFAADLVSTTHSDGPWDAVLAHSIGGAAAVIAASTAPDWSRRLVLLDPALRADADLRATILANQLAAHEGAAVAAVAQENPRWHPLTVELRVQAARAASRFALERSVLDNPDWDVTEQAAHITVPTLVIAGDAAQGGMFVGSHGDALLTANRHIRSTVIDAGHNVHRDAPELVLEQAFMYIDGRTRGHA